MYFKNKHIRKNSLLFDIKIYKILRQVNRHFTTHRYYKNCMCIIHIYI